MKEIRITKVQEVSTQSGLRFKAFKAVKKDGKLIDVRFTRGCQNVPDHPCIIIVQDGDWNVDNNRQYPCVWVKQVDATKEFEYTNIDDDIF